MSAALGLAINNVLNIRTSANKWQGLDDTQPNPSFCAFKSVQYGLRAGARILLTYKADGICTIGNAIARWAPPSDNNPTEAYARNVAAAVGVSVDAIIDFDSVAIMLPMLKAMAIQETGYRGADTTFMDALRMAGVSDAKPKPIISSARIMTGIGTASATGLGFVTTATPVVKQVSDQLTPYADHNSHVAQIVGVIMGIAATLAVAKVILDLVHRKATGL